MTALPWVRREPVDPDREYLVVSSRLPLRRHRSIPSFLLAATTAVRRQLAATAGLVGYSLDADLLHRTFWTFSVWSDQASLCAFAASEPHRRLMAGLRPLVEDTRLHTATMPGSAIPAGWPERKAPVR